MLPSMKKYAGMSPSTEIVTSGPQIFNVSTNGSPGNESVAPYTTMAEVADRSSYQTARMQFELAALVVTRYGLPKRQI